MRLFYAIKIHSESLPELKSAFIKLKKDAANKEWDLKFSLLQNLHVTLRFLGEIEANQLQTLKDIGNRIAAQTLPFTLNVSHMDAFPEIHHARVIWAGVQNKKDLKALHEGLDQSLDFLNLTPESAYIPHLTLARLRNTRSVKDFLSPFERKDFGDVQIKEMGLFKSELHGHYPHYELIESFPFNEVST